MLVRRISREEFSEVARIRAIAFHTGLDEEAKKKEWAELSDAYIRSNWAAFDEDGVMTACVFNHDFSIRFDGQNVKMGGIACVASLPEYRYGGAVKAIFQALLRDARAEGEVFSALYPFSHEFYRKLGYEMVRPVVEYEFPPALVGGYWHTGWTKRMKAGEALLPVKTLYSAMAERYNMMLVREDDRYQIGDPFKEEQYTMLLGDGRGVRAYMHYRTDKENGRRILNVRDIAFEDAEGFRMCLGYIGRMSADYVAVKLAVPEDVPLMQMVPRPYEVSVRFKQQPMARTTNVMRALELMKKPEGTDFVIKVTDDFLPENSGVYCVTGDGVSMTEAQEDIEVSEQAFTLMALGALGLEEAEYRTDVKVSGKRDVLSRVFKRKPLYIADYF